MKEAVVEAGLAVLLGAGFYFAGWAYLSHYFTHFGIDITEIDIPLNTVFVFAFRPLKSIWMAAFLGFWAVGAAGYVIGQKKRLIPPINTWPTALVGLGAVVIAAAFFLLLNQAALSTATQYATDAWDGNRIRPSVPLNTSGSTDHIVSYERCLRRNGFIQVFAVPERTYLLCTSEYYPEKGTLHVLDKDRVLISARRIDRRF